MHKSNKVVLYWVCGSRRLFQKAVKVIIHTLTCGVRGKGGGGGQWLQMTGAYTKQVCAVFGMWVPKAVPGAMSCQSNMSVKCIALHTHF